MFINFLTLETKEIDLADFKSPYQNYGKLEREVWLDYYTSLDNKPKFPWHVRCNDFVHGMKRQL